MCVCLCILHTHIECGSEVSIYVVVCDGWEVRGCEYVWEGGPVGRQARAEEEGTERGVEAQEAGKGKGKLLPSRLSGGILTELSGDLMENCPISPAPFCGHLFAWTSA